MAFVVVDGVQAPEPRPDPHRHRLRGAVDPVGPHRPRRVPVPLLHGAAVRGHGPRLLHRRALARRVAADLGARPRSRRRSRSWARRCCGSSHRPLCAFVGVDSVNPGSQACPAVIPDFVLTLADRRRSRSSSVIGLLFVIRGSSPSSRTTATTAGRDQLTAAYRSLLLTGSAVVAALVIVSFLPDTAILTLTNIPVEPIALLVAIPLGYLAVQVLGSRDAAPLRRRVRRRGRRLVRRSSTRTSARCRCRPRWSPRTRASCRPTCTRSSSRSAR